MLPIAKSVVGITAISKTNGATASGYIDTLGADFLKVIVHAGTADVASNAPSVLKLSESATTDATNFSDIAAFVGGGGSGFTIGNFRTTGDNLVVMNVPLAGRYKRYIGVTVSPRTTMIVGAIGELGRMDEAPVATSNPGPSVIVNG